MNSNTTPCLPRWPAPGALRLCRSAGAAFLLALVLAPAAEAFSVTTVTGTIRYRDRTWDIAGHDGGTVNLPVRFARVELVDTFSGGIETSSETNATGQFSLTANVIDGRPIALRVLAESVSRGLVVHDGTTLNLSNGTVGPVWAASLPLGIAPLPGSLNVGTFLLPIFNDPTGGGRVGSPWNVLDVLIDALDFLVDVAPTVTTPNLGYDLDVHWPNPTGSVSYATFDGLNLVVGNSAGYDDAILHHEFGHVVHSNFGTNQSPGGAHSLCGTAQDARLSWSEGFATFWGSNALKLAGTPDPGIYVDTNGLLQTPNLNFSYRLEDATDANGGAVCSPAVFGNASELAVQLALWDLTDEVGDNANDPGADDDPFDGTVFPGGVTPLDAFWDVFTVYMHPAPAGGILGGVVDSWDFWDGWWVRGYLDQATESDAFVDTMDPWLDRRIELTLSQIVPDVYPSAATAFASAPPGATLEVRTFSSTFSYPADLVHDRRLRIVLAPGSPQSAVLGP